MDFFLTKSVTVEFTVCFVCLFCFVCLESGLVFIFPKYSLFNVFLKVEF